MEFWSKRHESFPDPLQVTLTHVPDVFLNLTKIPLCIKLTRIRQSFPKPNHLVFMPKRHKIPPTFGARSHQSIEEPARNRTHGALLGFVGEDDEKVGRG